MAPGSRAVSSTGAIPRPTSPTRSAKTCRGVSSTRRPTAGPAAPISQPTRDPRLRGAITTPSRRPPRLWSRSARARPTRTLRWACASALAEGCARTTPKPSSWATGSRCSRPSSPPPTPRPNGPRPSSATAPSSGAPTPRPVTRCGCSASWRSSATKPVRRGDGSGRYTPLTTATRRPGTRCSSSCPAHRASWSATSTRPSRTLWRRDGRRRPLDATGRVGPPSRSG